MHERKSLFYLASVALTERDCCFACQYNPYIADRILDSRSDAIMQKKILDGFGRNLTDIHSYNNRSHKFSDYTRVFGGGSMVALSNFMFLR